MRVLPPEAWVLKELRRGAQRRTSVGQPHGQPPPQAATPAAIVSCRERSQRVCPPKTGIDRFDWPCGIGRSTPPIQSNRCSFCASQNEERPERSERLERSERPSIG